MVFDSAAAGGRSLLAPRRLTLLAALALGLAAAGLLWAPTTAGSWNDGAFSPRSERDLIALTNRSRATSGLTALTADAELTAIARLRSQDMAVRGYFSHSIPPNGQKVFGLIESEGFCFTLAGENIGWNTYGDDVATGQIHDAFLGSLGHRANVMSDRWDRIGVGAYKGPDGKKLWTVLFADACDVVRVPPPGS